MHAVFFQTRNSCWFPLIRLHIVSGDFNDGKKRILASDQGFPLIRLHIVSGDFPFPWKTKEAQCFH